MDLDEMISCPACACEQAWEEALLGTLGNMLHFRCRACGWQFHRDIEEGEEATANPDTNRK